MSRVDLRHATIARIKAYANKHKLTYSQVVERALHLLEKQPTFVLGETVHAHLRETK